MTGNEIVSYVRRKVGEKTASFWEDNDIKTKVNEGSKQVARDTRCVKSYFTKTTVADQAEYTFENETEFLSESNEGVWIYDGTNWDEVQVVSMDYLNEEYPDWKNAASDQPQFCVIDCQAKKITLNPAPSSTYTGANYLKIYTEELTPDIEAWDTELVLPHDLHFAVAFWAIRDCKEDRGLYTQATYWEKMYQEAVHGGAVDTQHHPARKIRVRSYKD